MLLMWTSTLRGRSKPRKRLERPAGARERQVSHVPRAARRDAESGELVVAPEGPVDEHDVARGEPGEHAIVQTGKAGGVGHDAAIRAVAEDEPARLKLHARPVQVARCVAADLERLDLEARPFERHRPLRFECLPLGPAVALQDLQYGIPAASARARRLRRRIRAPACRLAQEQEPRRVVDLRVGQEHARDRRRADAVDLPGCERLKLLARVRRGVDEKPRPLAAADRQRRLRARSRPDTDARGLARIAVAVPLRKPSAGGRSEDANAQAGDPDFGPATGCRCRG